MYIYIWIYLTSTVLFMAKMMIDIDHGMLGFANLQPSPQLALEELTATSHEKMYRLPSGNRLINMEHGPLVDDYPLYNKMVMFHSCLRLPQASQLP